MGEMIVPLDEKLLADLKALARARSQTVEALIAQVAEKAVRDAKAYEDFRRHAESGDPQASLKVVQRWKANGSG